MKIQTYKFQWIIDDNTKDLSKKFEEWIKDVFEVAPKSIKCELIDEEKL